MRTKRDPSHKVIEYFENAAPPAAAAVLSICQTIVARRLGPLVREPRPRARRERVNDDASGITQDGSTPERMRG